MSRRRLVGSLFALFTLATVIRAERAFAEAITAPTLRAWLTAVFWVLQSSVAAAFGYFVLVRDEPRRPARESLAFAACAAALLTTFVRQGPSSTEPAALLIGGEMLSLLAAVWLLVSVLCLGRFFGVLPEARGLVTRGPYQLVRHPVYLGELGMVLGLVVAAPRAWNVAGAAIFVAAQFLRMRLEERALACEFPEYHEYARHTPRLIPPITRLLAQTAPRAGRDATRRRARGRMLPWRAA